MFFQKVSRIDKLDSTCRNSWNKGRGRLEKAAST